MKNQNQSALFLGIACSTALFSASLAFGAGPQTANSYAPPGNGFQPFNTGSYETAPSTYRDRPRAVVVAAPAKPVTAADREVLAQGALIRQVATAAQFYSLIQTNSANDIPDWVVQQAKGVLIVARGTAGAQGEGIAMRKGLDGKFSSPAFYNVSGMGVEASAGSDNVPSIAFLMTDKAMDLLTQTKFGLNGNVVAVAGTDALSRNAVDSRVDVIIYQQANSRNLGPAIAATEVSVDQASNHTYYSNPTITPALILAGLTAAPVEARYLVSSLNAQQLHNNPAAPGTVIASLAPAANPVQ